MRINMRERKHEIKINKNYLDAKENGRNGIWVVDDVTGTLKTI